jgi:PAS domain S-box-containing protein
MDYRRWTKTRLIEELERMSGGASDRDGTQQNCASMNENRLWREVVRDSPDHILYLDPSLKIVWVNHHSEGMGQENVIGRPLYEFVEKPRRDEIRAILENVRETGEPASYETSYKPPGADRIDYESRVRARYENGRLVGLILVARDVTTHKSMEHRMKLLNTEIIGAQARLLEEKDAAIRELSSLFQSEKELAIQKMLHQVETALLPVILKMRAEEGDFKTHVRTLEQRLRTLGGSFLTSLERLDAKLTPKEIELCGLIIRGLHSERIAREMKLSVHTVATHRKNIRKKLGLANQGENLTNYLRRLGKSP